METARTYAEQGDMLPKTKVMLHVFTIATEEYVFPCFLNDLAHLLSKGVLWACSVGSREYF